MKKYKFKTKPFAHQKKALSNSWDKEYFALLMEQGTGKTKVIVDNAGMLFLEGEITGLIVTAPNGVQRAWVQDQIPYHLSSQIKTQSAYWKSGAGVIHKRTMEHNLFRSEEKSLRVLTINYEAFQIPEAVALVKRFLEKHRVMWALDESHRIKNLKRNTRSEKIINLSDKAAYRRILTGTYVTESPVDAYSQMLFLSENILNFDSVVAFRSHFCVLEDDKSPNIYAIMQRLRKQLMMKYRDAAKVDQMMKHKKPAVIAKDEAGRPMYRNLDELQRLVAPHSFRVLKKDCLDLPPKIYERRYVDLNSQQRSVYNQLRDEFIAEYENEIMAAPMAMTRLMRLQQITGGFFKTEGGDTISLGKVNPKIECLLEILEDCTGKVLVWARFKEELRLILNILRETYGHNSAVGYWGDIADKDKDHNKNRFTNDPECRFFVSQQRSGGTGLNGLQVADTEVYVSNTFSLIDRLQSEDRAHRSGSEIHKKVLIFDIEAVDTLDRKVIDSLIAKKELADEVVGDAPTKWV